MALLLQKLYEFYNWGVYDLADPRTDHLPLVGYTIYPASIIIAYIAFVTKIGPEMMKTRKPYNLERVMVVYNFVQVVYCSFVVFEGVRKILFKLDWRCAPVDYSYDELPLYVTKMVWSYYIIKIIDLLDTVFFVLRKKDNQITFLHIYHHAGMVFMAWGGTKFLAGGHCLYLGIVNCFVHAVMYFYYLLTAYDKEYKKSLWWKKHITQLQLGQFTFFTFIYGQLLFRQNCKFPVATMFLFIPQNLFMTVLFADFYYKTYIRKKPIQKPAPKEVANTNGQEATINKTTHPTTNTNGNTLKIE